MTWFAVGFVWKLIWVILYLLFHQFVVDLWELASGVRLLMCRGLRYEGGGARRFRLSLLLNNSFDHLHFTLSSSCRSRQLRQDKLLAWLLVNLRHGVSLWFLPRFVYLDWYGAHTFNLIGAHVIVRPDSSHIAPGLPASLAHYVVGDFWLQGLEPSWMVALTVSLFRLISVLLAQKELRKLG